MRQEENKIKRPLFWVACAFLFGETGAIAGSRWCIWAAIIFAALFVMRRCEMTVHMNDRVHKWRNAVFVWLIFVFVGIAGYCNMSSLRTQENFVKCVAGASCKVSGIIYDRQETTSGWVIQIRAKKVFVKGVEETKEGAEKTKEIEEVGNKLAYSGQMKIVAYMSTSEKPILGQDVVLSGVAALPEHATNPGGFDAADYYKAKKIFMFLKDTSYVETGVKKSELLNTLHGIKERVTSVYDQTFEPKAASVLSAMVLGDKRGLDRDTRNMYQLNGIAHILAISGVKTLKLDIPLVPKTRINWAFVLLHIAIIYILKLCVDEEIIPRCRFPCSREYLTKCINWQKKQ